MDKSYIYLWWETTENKGTASFSSWGELQAYAHYTPKGYDSDPDVLIGIDYSDGRKNLSAEFHSWKELESFAKSKMKKGGRTMRKRRIKQNPSGIIYLGLGTLVVGGVVTAIFLLRKKNGGTTSGKTTLTQAEIATLYQQWLAEKKTNPGGVTGWLNAILSGVGNALQVVNFFNAQKGGGGQGAG